MESWFQDLRFAFRGLMHTPGFTAAAVLTLALGIGANTAIFTIVDHVVLRPLAYQDPGRLFAVHEVVPKFANIAPLLPVSADHFVQWKQTIRSFDQMALIGNINFNLTGSGEPEQLLGARVSTSLFPMLGVRPQLGRTFLEEEDQPGHDRVVVLNDDLWRRRFAADPHVIGQKIVLNGDPFEVVGVLPANFRFPRLAELMDLPTQDGRPQLWKPFGLRKDEIGGFGDFNYPCIARLKPSVSASQALAELNAIQTVIGKNAPPEPIDLRATLVPLAEQITHRSKAGLEILLAAVGVVLMIGCVNITNLILARATNRRKEIAIRSALGASFSRLLWQMLTESALLSLFGAAAGIALAHGLLQLVLGYVPIDLPRMDEVRLDGRIFGFTLALSVVTSLVCGLLPAWYFAKADPQVAMKAGSRVTTAGPAATRLQSMLVGAEVGLAAVCLIVGGLLLHSLVRLLDVDRGFQTAHVIALDISLPASRYLTLPTRAAFLRSAIAQLEALPDISSVGVTNRVPATGQSGNNVVLPEGADSSFYDSPIADVRSVNPDFFQTMTIPLKLGRVFRDSDGERAVAVISTSLAERAWPGQNPIGRRFHLGSPTSRAYDVVGVAGEIRGVSLSQQNLSPTVYVPYWIRDFSRASLVVKTTKDPVAAYGAIRHIIRVLDSELPVPAPRTMEDVVTASVAPRRFQMQMVLAFAATALLLAALGIYGVVSYSVGQRTNELGLRIALGAAPRNISAIVLNQAMRPVACGLAGGLVAAAGIGRMLRSLLFGVTPADPATLALVTAVLLVVASLACYLPARRAMHVDPIVALRTE